MLLIVKYCAVTFLSNLCVLKRHYSSISTFMESVYLNTNGLNGENNIDAENLKHVSSFKISTPCIEDQPEVPLMFLYDCQKLLQTTFFFTVKPDLFTFKTFNFLKGHTFNFSRKLKKVAVKFFVSLFSRKMSCSVS